jgi:hypothetical protein
MTGIPIHIVGCSIHVRTAMKGPSHIRLALVLYLDYKALIKLLKLLLLLILRIYYSGGEVLL